MNRITIANRGSPGRAPPPRNRGPTRAREGPPHWTWRHQRRGQPPWGRYRTRAGPVTPQRGGHPNHAHHRIPPELAIAVNAPTIRNRHGPTATRDGPTLGRSPPRSTGPPGRGDPGEGREVKLDSNISGQGSPILRLALSSPAASHQGGNHGYCCKK